LKLWESEYEGYADDRPSLTLPVTKSHIYKGRKNDIFSLEIQEVLIYNEDDSTEHDSARQGKEDKSKGQDIVYISCEENESADVREIEEKDGRKDEERDKRDEDKKKVERTAKIET